jgi:recombination protein RecT
MSKQPQNTQQRSNMPVIANINLEQFLAQNQNKFKSVMPRHFDMHTLFRLTVTEVNKNPELFKCTTESLIGALVQCAQVGLEIGTGKVYFVPYFNNKKGVLECQFQIGYKGLIELALRSDKVLKVQAVAVFEYDDFYIEYGTNEKLRHVPTYDQDGNRGNFVGAYAIAQFKNEAGTAYQFEYMTKSEIDEVKILRSKSASKDFSPWKTDPYEMAKKTVTKRLCKYLPSSTELQEALELDDKDNVYGMTIENEEQKEESKTNKLKQSLQHQKAEKALDSALNQSVASSPENVSVSIADRQDNEAPDPWVQEYDKS